MVEGEGGIGRIAIVINDPGHEGTGVSIEDPHLADIPYGHLADEAAKAGGGVASALRASLGLDRQRPLLGKRRGPGEHLRHAVGAGTGLLEDRPPGGDGLESRRHPGGGHHEQEGRNRDSGPERHARVLPEAVPTGATVEGEPR